MSKQIDYRDFSTNPKSLKNTPTEDTNRRWWLLDKKDRPDALGKILTFLNQYDSQRQTNYNECSRLYGNMAMVGINGLSVSMNSVMTNAIKDRVTYNVVQSVIDTINAKLSTNKPKPLFLTSGGNWAMHRKAKKLNTFVDGIFYENKTADISNEIMRDGDVWGDGFIHVFDHYGRVKHERTMASELYVDWMEAYYGKPRQLHHAKSVDRDCLIDLFPDHKSEIMDCPQNQEQVQGLYSNISNQITVVESFHLPSGPDAKDGLRTINIASANLCDEPWDKSFFPYARYQPCKKLYGFYGQGSAERLKGIQLEINKMLYVFQRSYHLAGSFKILMEKGSKIVKEHLNNNLGAMVEYTNTPPQYVTPPVIPMEMYAHLKTLKDSAFEVEGVSQMSAAGVKPAGLNSGKAIREFHDVENDRMALREQAMDRLYMDLSSISIDCARDIYRNGTPTGTKSYPVRVPGKKFIQSIDWKDIDLEDDEFIMKMFPVSQLPSDPAGRLATIQEYVQAGWISQRTGRRLMDVPDLEQVEDLLNAEEEYVNMVLDDIVDKGKYVGPEPEDDLQMCLELQAEYYAQGKLHGLSEDRLGMLRRFKSQVLVLQRRMQMALVQQQPGAVTPPGANPQAVPQSQLLSNNPAAVTASAAG